MSKSKFYFVDDKEINVLPATPSYMPKDPMLESSLKQGNGAISMPLFEKKEDKTELSEIQNTIAKKQLQIEGLNLKISEYK